MHYKTLGNTGLQVSTLCFGTMTFGDGRGFFKVIGSVGQVGADELVKASIEGGINFFDTADVYTEGVVGVVAIDAGLHQTANDLAEMDFPRRRQRGTFFRHVHLIVVHDFSLYKLKSFHGNALESTGLNDVLKHG
jgi:Aldo/keto reductase family